MRAYQSTVSTTIGRFGGFIARYVGDGVLIYFGWPKAHETDAEWAIRAGLAVRQAIGAAPIHGEWLSIRIGIATGVVVVGAPIGDGDTRPTEPSGSSAGSCSAKCAGDCQQYPYPRRCLVRTGGLKWTLP